jgi:hypothetical protein
MNFAKSLFIIGSFMLLSKAAFAQDFLYKFEFPGTTYKGVKSYLINKNEILVTIFTTSNDTLIKIPKLTFQPKMAYSLILFITDTTGNVKWAKHLDLNHTLPPTFSAPIKRNNHLLINITGIDIGYYDGQPVDIKRNSISFMKINADNGDLLSLNKPIVSESVCEVQESIEKDGAIFSLFYLRNYILPGSSDTVRPPGYGYFGAALVKQDLSGNILWIKSMSNWGKETRINSISIDKDDRLVLSGTTETSLMYEGIQFADSTWPPFPRPFILATDLNGKPLSFYISIPKNSSSNVFTSHSIPDGRLIVHANSIDTLHGFREPNAGRGILARFDRNLNPMNTTTTRYFVAETYTAAFQGHAVDPAGNTYLTGNFIHNTTLNGISYLSDHSRTAIMKYDRWLRPQQALTQLDGLVGYFKSIIITATNQGFLVGSCYGNMQMGSLSWYTSVPTICFCKFEIPNILPDLQDTASIYLNNNARHLQNDMLHIYPNPSFGKFVVSVMPVAESGFLRVVNINGIEVRKIKLKPAAVHQHIELNNLPRGTYWIHLETPSFHTGKMAVVE